MVIWATFTKLISNWTAEIDICYFNFETLNNLEKAFFSGS